MSTYVLKYREPGARAGTARWAKRKVASVTEAIGWMKAHPRIAFCPAFVETNGWRPETVAILGGPDRPLTEDEIKARLADAFCQVLNTWLKPEQIKAVVLLNKAEADPGVCHMHDICDPNQAMLDAWEVVFGKGRCPAGIREGTTDAEQSQDDDYWLGAWRVASERGFALK